MNIDELEAGPELDALVAERVMGWRRLSEFRGEPLDKGWIGFWDSSWFKWIESPNPEIKLWRPSRDIRPAWDDVVQRLRSRFFFEIALREYADGMLCFSVFADNGRFDADSRKLPEAICRAALKAVGEGDA